MGKNKNQKNNMNFRPEYLCASMRLDASARTSSSGKDNGKKEGATTAVDKSLPESIDENSLSCSGRSNESQQWAWKLDRASPLPMFYPIQEWNTFKVPEHLPLNTITSRISEFLRLNSIETKYNNEQGFVRCKTIKV